MNVGQRNELLYQALETELGGTEIYKTAISCAIDSDLKNEWEEYLEHTTKHVGMVESIFDQLGLDKAIETPGRKVVRRIGESLMIAMQMVKAECSERDAEFIAAECLTHAKTKDHKSWELISRVAEKETGEAKKVLKSAYEEVEEEKSEHLYHTNSWGRELWIESLGMPAVLPPPEEEKDVKTGIGQLGAQQARTTMV